VRSPGLRRLEQEAPRREARAEGRCCGRRTDTLPSKCFFSMGQSASARPRTRRSRRSAVFPRATCLDGRLPGRLSVLVVNSPVPTHAQHEHIVKACRSTATAARRRSPAALESVEVLQSAGSWETALHHHKHATCQSQASRLSSPQSACSHALHQTRLQFSRGRILPGTMRLGKQGIRRRGAVSARYGDEAPSLPPRAPQPATRAGMDRYTPPPRTGVVTAPSLAVSMTSDATLG